MTLYVARVEYRAAGRDLTPSEFPISLFLPAPNAEATSTATLEGFPIATTAFKDWITNPTNFPANLLAENLIIEARIILRARTDEGRELETEASVSLAVL